MQLRMIFVPSSRKKGILAKPTLNATIRLNSSFHQDLLANLECSLLVAKDPEVISDLVITLHGDVHVLLKLKI
ncbi:hypothetical protein HanRHA438_Chr01g0010871 [Helianthus annuus]|nr:hypothetical protein HanHA89_Chr01g0009361 [Helianthus annuus]KAJ0782446.1 hypothetical protein HanLR1_Chr01g0008301 [Helianthus annuus]KAJ0947052.1 hypothetical protein HanRHA438_Chr01g0010871 [Helianthus annuus]